MVREGIPETRGSRAKGPIPHCAEFCPLSFKKVGGGRAEGAYGCLRSEEVLEVCRIDHLSTAGHDYCSVPEPAAVDLSSCENEKLKREIEDLRKQLEQLRWFIALASRDSWGLMRTFAFTQGKTLSVTIIHI